MNRIATFIIISALGLFATALDAQDKKVWVSGAARGVLYGDDYLNKTEEDTVTARKLQSGHTLADIGLNLNPSKNIYIQGEVRIRNDYGGFWGSGVTFDVRRLYLMGVVGGVVKYQIGDIDYKMTPYTTNNAPAMVNRYKGALTGIPLDQVEYDLFYNDDHTWRQQGAAIDFGLQFSNAVEALDFNFFAMRNLWAEETGADDRIFAGGSLLLVQSKTFKLGGQFVNLFDFSGTSNSTTHLENPVVTATAELMFPFGENNQINASIETGQSRLEWKGDEASPVIQDYFYDLNVKAMWKRIGLSAQVGYRDVGAGFRSAGAQTLRINYNANPRAYERYGNGQELRPISMMELYRDASLYNTQVQEGLMVYDPRYDNATPYGVATPNRRGFLGKVDYTDPKDRWFVKLKGEFLSDVVGQGTPELKNYTTTTTEVGLHMDKVLGMNERMLRLTGVYGTQNTNRSGAEVYEESDLALRFLNLNLTVTLFASLDLIGEYRQWKSNGSDQLEERNMYSEVIDYNFYTVDYNEQIYGGGLQYRFTEKAKLSALWQSFELQDQLELQENYQINTWTVFFTMKF